MEPIKKATDANIKTKNKLPLMELFTFVTAGVISIFIDLSDFVNLPANYKGVLLIVIGVVGIVWRIVTYIKKDSVQIFGTFELVFWALALFMIFCGLYIYSPYNDDPRIELEVRDIDGRDGKIALTITGNSGNYPIQWYSSNENIATVENGIVCAVSNGEADITALITIDGVPYYAKRRVSVNKEQDSNNSVHFKYIDSIPAGVDQNSYVFADMINDHNISIGREARSDKFELNSNEDLKIVSEKIVGYAYWHWCRNLIANYEPDYSPYDGDSNPHNRLSFPEKTELDLNNNGILDKDELFHSFTCFFSERYLAESDMTFDNDEESKVDNRYGRSVWYSDSSKCYDSYWFWCIPVYEVSYQITTSNLNIDVIE